MQTPLPGAEFGPKSAPEVTMKRLVHEAPLQLAVGHRTACMMVSNDIHEEDCQKT